MTVYRLVELHCDGDGGDCPEQPDWTRAQESVSLLWKIAKGYGWVRRRVGGRVIHLCPDCQKADASVEGGE